jgi:hypothetical protein
MFYGYIANVECLATIFIIDYINIFNTLMHLRTAGEVPIEYFCKIDESERWQII